MKFTKLFFTGAVCAMMALASACSNKGAEATDTAAEATDSTVQTEAAEKTAAVIELAQGETFDLAQGKPVIVDFNATWCGPCKMIAPSFHALANDFIGRVKFYSVDIDRCPETAKAFGIEAIPTFVLIRPDGRTERFVGTDSFATDTELNRASNIEEVTSIILPRMREVLDKNLK